MPFSLSLFSGKLFWAIVLPLLVLLLFFYVFQINEFTADSFWMSEGKRQMKEIARQNNNLQLNIFKNNSLGGVEELVQAMEFEKIEKVHHIKIMGSAVAAK